MYCTNCGKEIEDGAPFCIFCGTSQEREPPQSAVAPNPVKQLSPSRMKRDGREHIPTAAVVAIAVLSVAVLALGIVLGIRMMSGAPSNPAAHTVTDGGTANSGSAGLEGANEYTFDQNSPAADEASADDGVMSASQLVDEGERLFAEGDYTAAFESFSEAADLGDVEGLYWRGYCYYYAYGTSFQWERAYEDFLAAAPESPRAAAYVGTCLYYGRGVAKDREASYEWFRDAAAEGDPVGQNGLGNCYKHGIVVSKDSSAAIEYYRLSAEQGYAMGQVNLGVCYDEGIGTGVDHARAAEWYTLAADQGNSYAQYYLALMYYDGEGVPVDYDRSYEYARAAAYNEHDPSSADDARALLSERFGE